MILSDLNLREIINSKQLIIEPLKENAIQQNGLDFRLNDELAAGTSTNSNDIIDSTSSESIKKFFQVTKTDNGYFVLEPHRNYLLTTQEYLKMPNDIMGFCGLRSTFARLGFVSPLTIIDAGFEGTLTIGVFYGGSASIRIPVGCRFLHVVFGELLTEVEAPYRGQYKSQKGLSLPKALV